jgi:hypothetical protein
MTTPASTIALVVIIVAIVAALALVAAVGNFAPNVFAQVVSPPMIISPQGPQGLAQISINQVSGTGNGVLTCPSSSTANIGSMFNAATDQNGQLISGAFSLQTLLTDGGTTTPLTKTGTITNATITSNNGFTMTGTENTDTICGTAPGATITITGPCFPTPGATGTIQFTASNGETATIQGNVACVLAASPPTTPPPIVPSSLAQLFKNQGLCIAFANQNPSNTMGITKQACMIAFQNKFTNIPQQQEQQQQLEQELEQQQRLLGKFF